MLRSLCSLCACVLQAPRGGRSWPHIPEDSTCDSCLNFGSCWIFSMRDFRVSDTTGSQVVICDSQPS
ncbi:hypothetical protein PR003_g20770 [Phytophthora rubi]|uniref:Uncharacterized protein n=1 Tax=Phytophthora rubi TaxID=129364 RepID=A0A6A4DLI6_9STRA|nr:hypothetical protein PR003_g20770 [Phytophthora rubi]